MAKNKSITNLTNTHILHHSNRILREFCDFLSLPNHASSTEDIRKNAVFIKEMFERRGVKIEIDEMPGASPFIYGEYNVPSAKQTILLYAHYDGQPVNPSQWQSDPWKPVIRTDKIENGGEEIPINDAGYRVTPDCRIYARSASDDKAPFIAIAAALDVLRENDIPITSNLKFIFEGEEEIGSPHLIDYLKKFEDKLQADVLAICDGPIHQSGRPQLFFGARGFAGLDITVYGPERHLHSGHYGNWVPNPSLLLVHLLASMKESGGKVLINGFYEGADQLSDEEKKNITTFPDNEEKLKAEFGIAKTEGEGEHLIERLLLPSLNIRGLDGGAAGKHAQNVIPASASASIDMRLVKGIDPDTMLDRVEEHIRRQGFHIIRDEPDNDTRMKYPRLAKIIRQEGYPAVRTRMDIPEAQFIRSAVERVADDDVVLLPTMGASLPLYMFEELLKLPIVGIPIANYDNNQHGQDENIRVGNLWYGMKLFSELFSGE